MMIDGSFDSGLNCEKSTPSMILTSKNSKKLSSIKNELKSRNCLNFVEFVKEICIRLLKFKILPHTNLGYLTYNEIKNLKNYNASMGLMLESTSMKLFEKGEVHEHSPGKVPKKRIEHIKNAGRLKIPFTTGLLLGIGETIEDVIGDLFLIKEINNEYGHIQEVIIQNFIEIPH